MIYMMRSRNAGKQHYMKCYEMACQLMVDVMCDNGCINRIEPERYNLEYIKKIADAIDNVLVLNPGYEFSPKQLELIATGGCTTMDDKIVIEEDPDLLIVPGVMDLYNVLTEYFDTGMY